MDVGDELFGMLILKSMTTLDQPASITDITNKMLTMRKWATDKETLFWDISYVLSDLKREGRVARTSDGRWQMDALTRIAFDA